LARLLSKFGVASRTQASTAIAEGRVAVNGVIVRSPACWVDPRHDRVTIDGSAVRPQQLVYLAMNKPAGYVTTRSDERGRATVYDLLPSDARGVFPVGRLDKETTGLLIFTNDTHLGERITGPDHHIPKIYAVQIDRPLEVRHRRIMEEGVVLGPGERLLPARVVPAADLTQCEVTIREGRNRQVRRMFERYGYSVLSLHRTRIGTLALGTLRPGKVRALHPGEVEALSALEGGRWGLGVERSVRAKRKRP
jgi:23S rRNA pseudouridine2605 synthase